MKTRNYKLKLKLQLKF